jgi:hypothetical protein
VGSARPCGWSSATPTPESAAGFVEEMKPYAGLGIREVVLMPFGPDPVGFVGRLAGTVVPDLAGL